MASTTSESTADFSRGRRVRVRQEESVGPAGTRIEVLEPAAHPSGGSHTASASESVSGVQVGAGGALASGEREVAGEVGEGQLVRGNQLTWRSLPAGIAGGAAMNCHTGRPS